MSRRLEAPPKTKPLHQSMSIAHTRRMPNWAAPSISSVRAFEAAARLLSFTRAATELSITQSAVSHSVRDLESRLGVTLFVRQGKTLSLSDAGRQYLPFATEALARLRAGDRAVLDPQRKARILTVSVSPSFAAKWLVPRLGAFSAAHPDLDLRISANPQHVDFVDGEIDVAVRHGHGDWAALCCAKLCDEALFAVCSASTPKHKRPASPEALRDCTLIHQASTHAWRTWLRSFGVDAAEALAHGPVLSEMSLVLDAASAGQGVGLARSALASRDLIEGRLIRPMRHEMPAPFGYWIVCPSGAASSAKIARFRDWALSEAQRSEGARRGARKRKEHLA
jgi:LysR family glycine cleavage system transcriptional activator